MTRKILVATDGSKYSDKAIDYAIGLAKDLQGEVTAIYVMSLKHFEIYALEHHDDIKGYVDEDARVKKEGEDALASARSKGEKAGIVIVTQLLRGYPSEEIMKFARNQGMDLIVLGNLGKSGVERLLLGSVSEAVVRNAPCPVLVVRGV